MARLPQVTGEETLRRLKRLGMEECRRSSSHVIVQNPETGDSSWRLVLLSSRRDLWNRCEAKSVRLLRFLATAFAIQSGQR